METRIQTYLKWGIPLVFILLNAVFLLKEFTAFSVLPLVFLILVIGIYSLRSLFLLTVFFIPFSVPLEEFFTLGFNLHIPTEPLLAFITFLFFIKVLMNQRIDKHLLTHPVSLAIYFYLLWMLITSISSSMPLVSFKFLLSRIWFIVPFYFLAAMLFKNQGTIKWFMWLFMLAVAGTIIFTLVHHSMYGLTNQQAAHWVMKPLYNDHTAYGAVLAFIYPFVLHILFTRERSVNSVFKWLLAALFTVAIIFSYTRATWLSLVAALGVLIIMKLRIRFWVVAMAGIIGLFAILFLWPRLMIKLEQNRQDSSGDFAEHIQSMSNISSDASNLERINRWNCALRMFKEKPVLGWGPGTYQFQYAPFQFDREKTIISTNAGNMGNAHSEYLGPLAESGVMGTISVLLLIAMVLYTAINLYYRLHDSKLRSLLMAVLLGYITYIAHGFLNNFLDTDKASALFWGFTAIIVSLDVYAKKQLDNSE